MKPPTGELGIEEPAKDDEQVVLVRVVEWTEYIPSHSDANHSSLTVHSGITGFSTSSKEKVLEVAISGTGINKEITGADGAGNEVKRKFGLYAFQALLAQNISSELYESLMELQRPPEDLKDEGRNRKDDLVIIQNGKGKVPPLPPKKRRK